MRAETWDAAVEAILKQPVEVAVVDPGLEGEPRTHEIERLRLLFPSLPILVYTQLSPALAPILLGLGEVGIRRLVLARHDDHPNRLYEVLSVEAAESVSGQILHTLAHLLGEWPHRLKWAMENVLREPAALQSVQHLAQLAGMDRRTCLRWFARAHLPQPRVTLMVLRVVYAHRLLQDPGYSIEDVAMRLGYAQTRSFAQNVKEVLGMSPGELRVSLRPDEVLAMVHERYFQRQASLLAGAQ